MNDWKDVVTEVTSILCLTGIGVVVIWKWGGQGSNIVSTICGGIIGYLVRAVRTAKRT